MVQKTGRIAIADLQVLIDRGYVEINSQNGHVNLTLAGKKAAPERLSPQSLAKARKFLKAHVNYVMIGDRLVSGNGSDQGVSRYVAEFFIDDGTIVLNESGRYVLNRRTLEVSGDIYPAVKAFVEMLERARG